ncbi:MAG: asparagine synthetase B family protein [Candidatus Sericytochromatia bacterium]
MLRTLWRPAPPEPARPTRQRASQRLLGRVGPEAVLDLAPAALQVEWDHCWWRERPLESLKQWEELLEANALSEVNGAFALAWLRPDGRLLLARDAVGERTLFYQLHHGTLTFASTLDQLLSHTAGPRTLNPLALARYLSYAYVPGSETLIAGVHELPPGSSLLWVPGEPPKPEAYWQVPGYRAGDNPSDEATLTQALRACLERAVQRRLPTGEIHASLSGGVDSSLVVALAARLSGQRVHTYSLSFGERYRHELPYSQAVANHCRTQHTVLSFAPEDVLDQLDAAMAQLGNPIGDPLTAPNYLLFQHISARSGVVFNGEGGDPNFGGPKNLAMVLACLYGSDLSPSMSLETLYLQSYRKCFGDLERMLPAPLWEQVSGRLEPELAPWFADARWDSLVNRLMAINVAFKGCHHILYKVNHLSQPWGVVPASPLFDRELTELAFAIPPELKLRGTCEKYLLKQAVRDLLPALIIDRPKSGMMVPVEGWFQPGGPLHRRAKARLRSLAQRDIFEPGYLKRLMAWELGGYQPRHGAKVWILLALESWLRHYLPR